MTQSNHLSIKAVLNGRELEASWPAGGVDLDGGPLRFAPAALAALQDRGIRPPPTALHVTSDLPAGRGFSSSAAFTLAIVDVLARRGGRTLRPFEAADLAFVVEHDLLGVDCGRLDQIVCASRAPVFIRWGDGSRDVRTVQPGAVLHLVVMALATPRDGPAILRALHHDFSSPAGSSARTAAAAFASAAEVGVAALEGGDSLLLGTAMNDAQAAYEEHLDGPIPELRAPTVKRICADLISRGALGAKFSGAGGEGSVIALFATEAEARAAVKDLRTHHLGSAYYAPVR